MLAVQQPGQFESIIFTIWTLCCIQPLGCHAKPLLPCHVQVSGGLSDSGGSGEIGGLARCEVCVRAKKGKCGTDTAPKNCHRRPGGALASGRGTPASSLGGGSAKSSGARNKVGRPPGSARCVHVLQSLSLTSGRGLQTAGQVSAHQWV